MNIKKSKPLTIFLGVIVALIWGNGIRVFINSYYNDDYSDLLPKNSTKKTTKNKSSQPVPKQTPSSIPNSSDVSPKTPKLKKLVTKEYLANLKDMKRDPFEYYRVYYAPKKKQTDKKGVITDYQKVETMNPQAKDPGPGIRLIGLIQGKKSSALLVSNKGTKKLVFEGQEFELNTIVKILADKIIVDHLSGRSYVVDRVGWRPIQK